MTLSALVSVFVVYLHCELILIWKFLVPQVGEQLDLLDLYVQKVIDKKLEEAMKQLNELGENARTTVQTKLKSSD